MSKLHLERAFHFVIIEAPGVKECNGAGAYKVQGIQLVGRQFWALLVKRFHNVRRSKKGFVSEVSLLYYQAVQLISTARYTRPASFEVKTFWIKWIILLYFNKFLNYFSKIHPSHAKDTQSCSQITMVSMVRAFGSFAPRTDQWTWNLLPPPK